MRIPPILLSLSFVLACGDSKKTTMMPAPIAPVICTEADDLERADDVRVAVDDAPELAPLRADLAEHLGKMWGKPIAVESGAPAGRSIWISKSDAARAKLAPPKDGYAMRRMGSEIVVSAVDARTLAAGGYALLEELGARYFHPRQSFFPALGAPMIPKALDVARAPWVKERGLQIHTLHPLEYNDALLTPGAENLEDAKRLVDWLVRTGQNYLQWVLLSTVPFEPWEAHAKAIVDYAHARGVRVGINVTVFGASSLQNQYVLVKDASKWQAEIDAKLDPLAALFDVVDLSLGEFFENDPQATLDWMSYAVARAKKTNPAAQVNVHNHIGNYSNLYVPYQGKTVYFYHLPKFADKELGQRIHTLAFFDLYRDWATYAHPNFFLQRDYLFEVLPDRRVTYYPESAYWIGADVDVPLFLPEYAHARWIDVHNLARDVTQKGLPPLHGHLMFSSGHEWGYWLTDYLTAKMLWEPEKPLSHFYAHFARAFGSCGADIADIMNKLTDIQSRYLFDERLMAYVQGENTTVDVGFLLGFETHPKRVEFEQVLAMSEPERASFERKIVGRLVDMIGELRPLEDAMKARAVQAEGPRAPFLRELYDGVAIDRVRAAHAVALYRAVLALARKQNPELDFISAVALTGEAREIVLRRAKDYRFPLERLTATYDNATIYNFGYLKPAHTVCYYERREAQVRSLIDEGAPALLGRLPSCQ